MRLLVTATLLGALAGLGGGCVPTPEPGEYGLFRYVGNIIGSTPLALLPPINDREGNAYVLAGALDELQLKLFVGNRAGGWTGSCAITQGNQLGAHGFVGRAQDRAWYWAGGALVGASGRTGGCYQILEHDPNSAARLDFRAVVPWVRETPSRTTTVAWIQAPTDPRPFQAVIDLNNNVYTSIKKLSPDSATDVTVLGVGGSLSRGEGVVLARYLIGEAVHVEARFIDSDGHTVAKASVGGLDTLPAYGIRGYLQSNDLGLYAGLDIEGQLVVLDSGGGQRRAVEGMDPVGVHRWQGELYLVGSSAGEPKLARIDDDGDVGKVRRWKASVAAANQLGSKIAVIDDRSLPSHDTVWQGPRTAMGAFPFLHEHSLDHYADGTTTWLIAGPSFSAGGEDHTAIAYVPVGIAYE